MKLLSESFNTTNRKDVARLQDILVYLGGKIDDKTEDRKTRTLGEYTAKALIEVKQNISLPKTANLNKSTIDALNQKTIEKYYSSKTQTANLHRTLIKAARIAKLEFDISADMKTRSQGSQTRSALRQFQKKYGLKQTGILNKETLERLESVSASRVKPMKKLKVPQTERLMKVRYPIRLNMQKSKVADLQRALAWIGYDIDRTEANSQTYGRTTRKAVIAFQTEHGLPVSGNVGFKTAQRMNSLIESNSRMVTCKDKYRVRGSVRNSLWEGAKLATVQVFEKKMRDNMLLAERKTLSNGFYDLQYAPPIDPLTGKPKKNFQLLVRFLDPEGSVMKEKLFHVTGKVLWANFTQGEAPYRGNADFQVLEKLLNKTLGQGFSIGKIEESNTHKDISYLRKETGLAAEDIMKMTLAARTAEKVNRTYLTSEVFYAFIRQNQPHTIPGDLLPDYPEEWNAWINMLVDRCSDGIALLDKEIQEDILASALKQNYISRRVATDLPQVLNALSELQTDLVLEKPLLDGNGSLNTLLDASTIPKTKHTEVAASFCQSKGFTPDFWKSLEDISGIDSSAIEDLRITTDLGHITSTFGSMTTFLKNDIGTSQFKTVSDFAKLTKNDWVMLINQNGGKFPSWIKGRNTASKIQAYASLLKEKAEQRFPAISFVAEVDRSPHHALGSVTAILSAIEAKHDFDLKKDPCAVLFESTGSGFSEHEVAATKVLQRVHRIAPTAETGVALLESGYYSAAQVYREGKNTFAAAMKKKSVHADVATQIYNACKDQYTVVMAMIGNYHLGLQWVNPGCILPTAYTSKEIEELSKEIPDLETLFGPMDIREVRHCESVLGPSAYLTDVFRFLDQKKSKTTSKTVKDILFERRPDLGNIKLNCTNTNTALPYIDLVCEILENRVMDGDGSLTFQSTWPSEDLLAEPQYVEADAYERLKLAEFPLFAHFNLWQEETRMFLAHLGVPRHHLMETFLIDTSPAVATVNKCNTAAEYFGISDQEQQVIITERATNYWQKRYWSNDALGSEVPVSVFLQKSGLTYHQLLELLQCEFVNGQTPESVVLCPIDNCDLDLQKVDNMSLDRLDSMNRFLRLWKNSGLELWELDLLVMNPAIGNTVVNNHFLIKLKQFEEVRKTLKLSVEECAAFIGPINTRMRAAVASSDKKEKNHFENLFLSGSVDPQVFGDFSLLLNSASTTKNIDPYLPHVRTSLSCSNDELALLLPLTDSKLTRETLSLFFRYITLTRKLKSTLKDLFLFRDLAGVPDPFDSLDTVLQIIREKELLKESGTTLVQIEYLLTSAKDSSAGWRDTVYVQRTQALRESLAGLRDKITECDQAGDDSIEMLLAMLTPFEDAAVLQTAMDVISGTWSATQSEISDFITTHFTLFVSDITDAIDHLKYTAPATPAELEDRRAYCMGELLNYLNRTTIKEFVAVAFGLESSQADVLLNTLHLPSQTESLLTILQDEKLHARDDENEYMYEVSPVNLPDVFAALLLLHKASLAARCLKCSRDELAWLVTNPSLCNTLDFNLLPLEESQSPVPMDTWLQTWRFLRFKRSFPEPENTSFFKVLETAATPSTPAEAINAELCKVTGWDELAHGHLHNSLLDYCSPETYEWFLECHRQNKITGADFQSLFKLAELDPDGQEQEKAHMARDMAQAKYSREQWLKVLKPIMDTLREKKRDALTAYLIERSQREKSPEITVGGKKVPNPEYWTSPNDLYAWFLIDVEMCSDQLTSRIKQAILSTQLFVQRCFLNLENRHVEVALPDPDQENNWDQWKWMKNYRIWEANRKVFLFPENWIEPELRDTKSPFFVELESDILSGEITNRNVEGALQRYILKLEEVSRLEVCSIFHEKDGTTDLLHVVARTRSMPAIFFYRNYDLYYSRWSPWEKIDNDIQSDHVVPWVYNRKLYLFWLILHDKPIKLKRLPPVKQSDEPVQNPEPAKMLEIELAWCVRQPDGWDSRKISKKKLIHPWERPAFSYNIKPRYKATDSCLYIDIYISTSKEFNESTFYDQFTHSQVRLTKVHYNETLRPWHSSSFVFDGAVKDVLLRGIPGYYFSPDAGEITNISSYEYVKANFGEEGADISPLGIISEQLALPSGMHYRYTRLSNNQVRDINTSKFNVFGPDKGTKTLLNKARSPFEAVLCQQGLAPINNKIRPLFYQDRQCSFFFIQKKEDNWLTYLLDYLFGGGDGIYKALPFYHPFPEMFQQEINRDSVQGLYRRNLQVNPQAYSNRPAYNFSALYNPVGIVNFDAVEKENLDFSRSGAYSIYNWELFFHAPLMIACRLSRNQRFEEAMQWFHYIFDPTNTQMLPTPQRFWITKPFYETSDAEYRKQRIQNIIENIDEFKEQLVEWKNHPFKPHLIAEYRTVAYQRTVVMKYIDNLIAWGDQLFRRDTMESINEATLLYVLAHELLGPKPTIVPAISREERTFNELEGEGALDTFGNAKVEVSLENTLGLPIEYTEPGIPTEEEVPDLEISYFGLPHNDKLLGYWDTVGDRLFKIRHGLNIEGLKRQLPLFEPPIDPALLVKAAAAGLDLASVLNDLNAPAQAYRFKVLANKAIDFCRDVKSLGDHLLHALEKNDAEDLAVLRSSNEVTLLETIRSIKKLKIEEISYSILSLERNQEACQVRIDQIKSLSEPLDAEEKAGDWSTAADVFKILSKVSSVGAMIASAIPDGSAGANGAGGTPEATVRGGGSNVRKGFEYAGKAFDAAAELCKWRQDSLKSEAAGERTKTERASKISEEEKAIASIDNQKLGKEILKQIAEKELDNFEKELEIKQGEYAYLRDKYTNSQLYQWMITQISTVYFQAYQLAYDMAKRAEKSYRRELGLTDSSFIQFGYWDSLKKGLLSADRLIYDIRRMESAYLDQHRRELEITKHASLARLSPDKLLELTMTGRCSFDLEEWMYNLDYPSHYRRRIKSVSVSVMCEADRFTNINCRLALTSSEVRISSLVGSGYAKDGDEDTRFIVDQGSGETIATSHGEYDNGLFTLKFDDERFLPFEGAGAVSSWDISMPRGHNQFDYSTLTDVILHINYTALEGGEALGTAAKVHLDGVLSGGGILLVGLKQCFPDAWENFLNPTPSGSPQVLTCTLTKEHYPFLARTHEIELTGVGMVVSGKHAGNYMARVSIPEQADIDCMLTKDGSLNNVHHKPDVFEGSAPGTGTFSVMVRRDTAGSSDFSSLPADDLEDIYLILSYS
jgi:peptidoglycan hydrolase-like protein with peptidoglycan-binding domain